MSIFRNTFKNNIFFFLVLTFGFSVNANSAEGTTFKNLKPGFSFEGPFGKFDKESLKRGYQVYSEVCSSCHGLKQLSFRNLSQPGGPEFSIERVKEIASGYSITDGFDEYGEPIERSMLPSDRFQDHMVVRKRQKVQIMELILLIYLLLLKPVLMDIIISILF